MSVNLTTTSTEPVLTPYARRMREISTETRRYGYELEDILRQDRRRPLVFVRAIIYAIFYERWRGTKYGSYSAMGRIFQRDHSTIMHGVLRGGQLLKDGWPKPIVQASTEVVEPKE